MKSTLNAAESVMDQGDNMVPPGDAMTRLRLPLRTAQDVRRELAKIYRDGKAGRREVADVSRLANVLQILGRMIETGDLEARIEKLEAAQP